MRTFPIQPQAAPRGSLKDQAGVDLIQLSVAVGIIAFILAVGFLVVPTVMTNIKVNSETSDIQQSVSNALRVYGSGADVSSLKNEVAVNLKLSPADRVVGSDKILNRFGGDVSWGAADVYGSKDGIEIVSKGYSKEACAKLVPNVQSLFAKISVGAEVVKDMSSGKPLDVAALGTQCNKTEKVDLTLDFSK
ncbi:type 4 pilus major pilin [Chromobacterium sp. IIBBL 290-4]|uniref:type 4 pilus major pilin n=1 Tax=Chromobacterium sp. IIBBL 290-4 TaxID=2953890 RepID=UPI0020B6E847|nr:type 4 pilus major pilin [Chromobacterium sp. IIBBL 290-4]UTH74132.1 hypothetical protein NKT35_21730 [Chromobacterium sp. IIBBL 290-4]